MSRPRISHSKLFDVTTCGEFYRRRYEEQDRTPGTLVMYRGSAIDSLANKVHTAQLDAKKEIGPTPEALIGTLPTYAEAAEIAVTAFEARIAEEGVTITRDDIDNAGSEAMARGRAKDNVALLGVGYVRLVAPRVNPLAVQRKIEAAPSVVPFDIVGVLDLVEEIEPTWEDATNTPRERVIDTKVPKRKPRKDAARRSEQLALYSLLRASETGKIPAEAGLRHIVDAGFHVEIDTQVVTHTVADLRAMLARMEAAVAAIQAGVFVPAQSGHWRCSANYCPFYQSCRFVVGRSE